MKTLQTFFWQEDTSLRRKRLLLGVALLLGYALWFILGTLLAVVPNDLAHQFLWGLFWLVGIVIAQVFALLLKTRQCQHA